MGSKRSSKSKLEKNEENKSSVLFQTLAKLEFDDLRATKQRGRSLKNNLRRSKCARNQSNLGGLLLELRIFLQRSLGEQDNLEKNASDGIKSPVDERDFETRQSWTRSQDKVAKSGNKKRKRSGVEEEIDAVLESFLLARRDLLLHRLEAKLTTNNGCDEEAGRNMGDVNYARIIQNASYFGVKRTKTNVGQSDAHVNAINGGEFIREKASGGIDNDGVEKNDGSDGKNIDKKPVSESDPTTLSNILQNEYQALKSHWQAVLNQHHSNLQLTSGLSTSSKFSNLKAVDVSFWDQVIGSAEQDLFQKGHFSNITKNRKETTAIENNNIHNHDFNQNDNNGQKIDIAFDDSKLYQQMLKDFVSSHSKSDPALEAAERLKRALRKKCGFGAGDGIANLNQILLNDALGLNSTTGIKDSVAKSTDRSNRNAKASIDRRASKGRKIRYVIHPKLVNFTFPIKRSEPMINEDVWFKSLFGGVSNL